MLPAGVSGSVRINRADIGHALQRKADDGLNGAWASSGAPRLVVRRNSGVVLIVWAHLRVEIGSSMTYRGALNKNAQATQD